MAVEDEIGVPEGVPVALLAHAVLQRPLLRVAPSGRDEGDMLRAPALPDELLDLVVGRLEGLLRRARHDGDGGTVAAERPHTHRCQWREDVGDLAGVAQVVVEDEGDELDGRAAEPSEDPLVLVRVDEQEAGGSLTMTSCPGRLVAWPGVRSRAMRWRVAGRRRRLS